MINHEEFNTQNFQSLLENYEVALKEVTGELDSLQAEQKTIKDALCENNHLSSELHKIFAEKCDAGHKYEESDLIENLNLQLKIVCEEKDQTVKLWQNATDTIEHLENELKVYQDNTQGLVPKSKLIQLKNSYEEKLNELQTTVTRTKIQLEETISQKSRELLHKDKEITGSLQSQSNTFKIIKNLEEEVLNLQQRLESANNDKRQLERVVHVKSDETEALKLKVADCRKKVEEALQVVEAALNEKDAALLRETEVKEEIMKLSQTLNNFIDETNVQIRNIKQDHETKLNQMKQALHTTQQLLKVKESEIENHIKKCNLLEMEIEKNRNNRVYIEESGIGGTSKMLSLEKNLESTFQKLLLSEKQNIQLKSEVDALKNDLEEMSHYYERDVNLREAEKETLKNEIKKIKIDLNESYLTVSQSKDVINNLNEKLSTMEINFKEQIKETKNSFQQTCIERQEVESVHNQIVQELQEQLLLQTDINKKWRTETKNITEQLENVISDLKMANSKVKQDNKILSERLKEANLKMLEYRKFLEMISHDVTRITTITIPEMNECVS